MVEIVKDEKLIETQELTEQQLSALSDPIRQKILKTLSKQPTYPAKIAEKYNTSKQKIYYHIEQLKKAQLIEKQKTENHSGGQATYYKPTSQAYLLQLKNSGEKLPLPQHNQKTIKFLKPLIEEGELKGKIVVGSPSQHGPDQVRALDGHHAADIAYKLGNYSRTKKPAVKLDTEIISQEKLEQSMIILGGVLTNVIAKKFNENFPAYFSSKEFPYRELETPENSYNEGEIGVIAKTPNPENHEEKIYLVAGIQNKGTRAAVKAFKDLEQILENYKGGRFYAVIKGLDLDSDGQIDDYEVIEKIE
jgi:DNA-binding transcriptional ArsR family regulator